jgi:hypothetical protein
LCLAFTLPAIVTENYSRVNDINKSIDVSQLINDQNDRQPLIASTTNEKPTTPAKISCRANPDGSRVSIPRRPLSTNHRSSFLGSRLPCVIISTSKLPLTLTTNDLIEHFVHLIIILTSKDILIYAIDNQQYSMLAYNININIYIKSNRIF